MSEITPQDDLRDLLDALGMFSGAQPRSPHEVMQDAIAVARRAHLEGQAMRRVRDRAARIYRGHVPPAAREGTAFSFADYVLQVYAEVTESDWCQLCGNVLMGEHDCAAGMLA